MKKFCLVVVAMMLCMASVSAQARRPVVAVEAAEEYINKSLPESATVWHCWYGGGSSILCLLGEVAENSADTATPAPALDARLPALVTVIRQQAAELAGRLVSIPLHTVPFDMALTGQLAASVMCGGAVKTCGVIFARNVVALRELVGQRSHQLAARNLGLLARND